MTMHSSQTEPCTLARMASAVYAGFTSRSTVGSVIPEPGRNAPPPNPPPYPGPSPDPVPVPAPVPGPEPAPPVVGADGEITPGSVISASDMGLNGTTISSGGGSSTFGGVGVGVTGAGTEIGSSFFST